MELERYIEDLTAHAERLDGVLAAVAEADYRWKLYTEATNELSRADALIELSNAMSDLRSWLPDFDIETGTVEWEREDHEQAH